MGRHSKKYTKLETIILYEEQELIKRTYPDKKNVAKKKAYSYRKRERYPRDESKYNSCQECEFDQFIKNILPATRFVLDTELPNKTNFKKYRRLHDGLICLLIKRYFGKSLRRSMSLIRYFVSKEFPDVHVPCFKTLNNYQNDSIFTHYIDKIMVVTAEVLSDLETRFTTDGTGEATTSRSTWYSMKSGKMVERKNHLIAQVTSTIALNCAVIVDVLDHEIPKHTEIHVEKVSQKFKIDHWSGDSAYLIRDLCSLVKAKGGRAHFRIKSNTIANAKGSQEWKRMVSLQKNHDQAEIDELNLRQNAESTNSAKKRKFGSTTLCKKAYSQINDIKSSWLCYNFSVLSRAFYEHDIIPFFLPYESKRDFSGLKRYT